MNNIGIISGGGRLPTAIGRNLISKNFKVFFFVLEEYFDDDIYKGLEACSITLQSVKKLISLLKFHNINNIILAGNITRPSLLDINFDFQTIKLAKNLLLNKSGDNQLLISIKNFFNENGFNYFNWIKYCPELFANDDNLTNIVDVVMLVSHILGNSNLDELGSCKADVNSDSILNIVDIVLTVNLILSI